MHIIVKRLSGAEVTGTFDCKQVSWDREQGVGGSWDKGWGEAAEGRWAIGLYPSFRLLPLCISDP